MRARLRTVIVPLLLLAGCGTDAAAPASPVPVPPDEWAAMRNIDSCAILDAAALSKLGQVNAPTFTGASAHNCVATITGPDGTQIVARAYVGERVAADAKQIDLGGTTAFQDVACTVTVKITGDAGISISVEGSELEKQCAQARDVTTAVAPKLKSPPQNQAASPFHGKDPCQPADQLARHIGKLKQIRRPTIINCELSGTDGTMLISHEIQNMAGHAHGEPVTVAGKEAMRHGEPDRPDRCDVMVMLKPALTSSYFITWFKVLAGSDPCGKATSAANEATRT